jgi:hypothetical protein
MVQKIQIFEVVERSVTSATVSVPKNSILLLLSGSNLTLGFEWVTKRNQKVTFT